MEVFRSSHACNDLKYFYNLQILKESENISDCDLEVYIIHLDKLRVKFMIHFGNLENMHVPELLVTSFDMKIDNKGYECDVRYGYQNYSVVQK